MPRSKIVSIYSVNDVKKRRKVCHKRYKSSAAARAREPEFKKLIEAVKDAQKKQNEYHAAFFITIPFDSKNSLLKKLHPTILRAHVGSRTMDILERLVYVVVDKRIPLLEGPTLKEYLRAFHEGGTLLDIRDAADLALLKYCTAPTEEHDSPDSFMEITRIFGELAYHFYSVRSKSPEDMHMATYFRTFGSAVRTCIANAK